MLNEECLITNLRGSNFKSNVWLYNLLKNSYEKSGASRKVKQMTKWHRKEKGSWFFMCVYINNYICMCMCINLCTFPYCFPLNFSFKITVFQDIRLVHVFWVTFYSFSKEILVFMYSFKNESSFISVNKNF